MTDEGGLCVHSPSATTAVPTLPSASDFRGMHLVCRSTSFPAHVQLWSPLLPALPLETVLGWGGALATLVPAQAPAVWCKP